MSFIAGAQQILGRLKSANMNSTADQAITITNALWIPTAIYVTNASTSLTTAVGGLYTTTSKGGSAIVANSQVYSALTTAAKTLALTIAVTDKRTEATLYLSLTTPQGGAATADLYIIGVPIT